MVYRLLVPVEDIHMLICTAQEGSQGSQGYVRRIEAQYLFSVVTNKANSTFMCVLDTSSICQASLLHYRHAYLPTGAQFLVAMIDSSPSAVRSNFS
jgi:hypothetical protein